VRLVLRIRSKLDCFATGSAARCRDSLLAWWACVRCHRADAACGTENGAAGSVAHIEQTVLGFNFNWDFWSRNTPARSAYPACRANMIRAIQSAYYQKVMNPLLAETLYSNAPAKSDWKYKHFSADLTSSVIEQELQHEIQLEWGLEVYSYPSLQLVHNDTVFSIAVNYQCSIRSTIISRNV